VLDAENRSLLGESSEKKRQTPFVKVSPMPGSAPKAFVAITMSSAFDKHKASFEAMLIIRTLAHQDLKRAYTAAGQDAFLENVQREVSIKTGEFEPEIMARDALMCRFLGKGKI
jgi:hypothetical protein